jgi:hypothetical protein
VSEKTLDHVTALFDVFRSALAAAAAPGARLLLVVDHVEEIAESESGPLIRDLFLPLARGEVAGVCLVLAARPPALDQLRRHGLVPLAADVEVGPVPAADYLRLAGVYHDLCRNRDLLRTRVPAGAGPEDEVRERYDAIITMARTDGQPWRIGTLFHALSLATASVGGG